MPLKKECGVVFWENVVCFDAWFKTHLECIVKSLEVNYSDVLALINPFL